MSLPSFLHQGYQKPYHSNAGCPNQCINRRTEISQNPSPSSAVIARIVAGNFFCFFHQILCRNSLACRIIADDKDCLFKETLIRRVHHHNSSGNPFYHVFTPPAAYNLTVSILPQEQENYTFITPFSHPLPDNTALVSRSHLSASPFECSL